MKPSVESKLNQLAILEAWCEKYTAENPRNHGSYSSIGHQIIKPVRDGVIFWSTGWGYRLRKNWREAIQQKRAEYQAEKQRFLEWFNAPNTASTGQAASGSQSDDNSKAACR